MHRYGNIRTWDQLKEILIKHFGEKESSDVLVNTLKLCRIESTIEQYYDKINEIASRIHNRILTHSNETFTTDGVNWISLRVFRGNLPEPTKTMIFARNPQSLDNEYKIIDDARQQSYILYGPIRSQFNNRTPFRRNFSNDSNNRGGNQTTNQYRNQPRAEDNPGTSNRQNIKDSLIMLITITDILLIHTLTLVCPTIPFNRNCLPITNLTIIFIQLLCI